jgi:hypothetical protein
MPLFQGCMIGAEGDDDTLRRCFLCLGTSHCPHPPILMGSPISGLHYGSLSLRPVDLLAPLSELTRFHPANGDFYFRAFDGLVTRTAAGYHYSGNWASSTDGIFTR